MEMAAVQLARWRLGKIISNCVGIHELIKVQL
jgi:hypothetical protein